MNILLVAEHDNSTLKPVNFHVLGAARELQGDIDFLVAGLPASTLVEAATRLPHLRRVLTVSDGVYEHFLPENWAQLIASLAPAYDYVLMPATTFGKNILPRTAALLGVAMVSDVVGILSPETFTRPVFAGNALETVQLQEKVRLLTVRSTAFAAEKQDNVSEVPVEARGEVFANTLSQFVRLDQQVSARPELTDARIVVSGGRGLKSAANFRLLEAFADSIGAAVGASRAAVDAGFAPNDWQVGQTGKIVAPDLYIAVGISGAIQHLAGMKDSKVIVAINSDPDAPIFQVADYGLVGDWLQILPALQEALQQKVH